MITPEFKFLNFAEATLWLTMGAACGVSAWRHSTSRHRLVVAAVALILFGLTDLVEMQTGAWWLLVWKGACVITLFGLLIWHFVGTHRQSKRRGQLS